MNTMTEEKIPVLDLRTELGVDQQTVADEAHVSQQTISRLERGENVTERVARQVFHAVNRLRKARGWQILKFEDIDWHLKS